MKFSVALTVAALVAASFSSTEANAASSSSAIDEAKVRCKVCDRAIAHVWLQGVELRKHCKLHNTDPRCHHSNVHRSAIEEMIRDVCEDVTKANVADYSPANGKFTMTAIESGEESQNDGKLDAVITSSCKRWVLEANTVPTLTRFIYANLDAGKPTQSVLNPLQTKFCQHACAAPKADDNSDEL